VLVMRAGAAKSAMLAPSMYAYPPGRMQIDLRLPRCFHSPAHASTLTESSRDGWRVHNCVQQHAVAGTLTNDMLWSTRAHWQLGA
jgi:hypothetical protein